jgi:hypothetical protein
MTTIDAVVAREVTPKPAHTLRVGGVEIPELVGDDPATLAAFYSGYAFFEMWRKVLLANCRETIRAQMTLAETKVTEARLDDLSHLHPAYLGYLTTHLQGRIKWEREHAKQGYGA